MMARWLFVGFVFAASFVALFMTRRFYRSDRAVAAVYWIGTHIPVFGSINKRAQPSDEYFRRSMTAAVAGLGVLGIVVGIVLAFRWA